MQTVERDYQIWQKWVQKGKLQEQTRKRRWTIVGGVVGGALLLVIGILRWILPR